jgi:ribonucleoside-diphosphate reductase alpha chain
MRSARPDVWKIQSVVGVTNAFLAALDARTPLRCATAYGSVTRTVDAVDLFNAIVEAAWAVGDPGLLFLDETIRHNPTLL